MHTIEGYIPKLTTLSNRIELASLTTEHNFLPGFTKVSISDNLASLLKIEDYVTKIIKLSDRVGLVSLNTENTFLPAFN